MWKILSILSFKFDSFIWKAVWQGEKDLYPKLIPQAPAPSSVGPSRSQSQKLWDSQVGGRGSGACAIIYMPAY